MLFAAGFGTRMGALTATQPKPLIKVANQTLLDHALQAGREAGITKMVVNAHYLASQIVTHLAGSDVQVSVEAGDILDTGGGLKAALPLLGTTGPVLTLNTDAIWTGANPLRQLLEAWDEAIMDQLFLLLPATQARSQTGRSDFVLDAEGRVEWAKGRAGHLYLGAQIIHPKLLTESGAFSLHAPWTRAIEAGRAYGVVHQGDWCDVGHPGGIAEAEALLDQAQSHV